MDDLHLTAVELESFFAKGRKSKRVVRHLLSGCEDCQRRAAETLETLGLDVGLLAEATEERASAEPSLETLHAATLITEEKKRAKVSFARLAPLSPQERLAALRKQSRYKKYGLALLLLEEAESLTHRRSYAKARELVRLATNVTELLRPGIYGPGLLGDLRLSPASTTFVRRRQLELCSLFSSVSSP